MSLKKSTLLILSCVCGGYLIFFGIFEQGQGDTKESSEVIRNEAFPISSSTDGQRKDIANISDESRTDTLSRDLESLEPVEHSGPFTAQAPMGRWNLEMYQDGCEEASAIMAQKWIEGAASISVPEADRRIQELTHFETKRFAGAVDLSPQDTRALLLESAEHSISPEKVSVKTLSGKEDIANALFSGAIVIAPTDGKALQNPNFTAGGPDRHMLVIRGYDPKTKEFITNDPGTRRGEKYRYAEDILWNAIRAYATGDHEPIIGRQKEVIVVKK